MTMPETVSREQFNVFSAQVKTEAKELRHDLNEVKVDVKQIRVELNEVKMGVERLSDEISSVRKDATDFRKEVREEFKLVRSEMGEMRDELRSEMGEMRIELRSEMRKMRDELMSELMALSGYMGRIEEFMMGAYSNIGRTARELDHWKLVTGDKFQAHAAQFRSNDREHSRYEEKFDSLNERVQELEKSDS
jgi:chromosome segregation ATPase